MSAGTQRNPTTQTARTSPAPKPMLRPNGIHHGKTRAEVVAKYQLCKWAGRALDMHLCRVTTGAAQIAWVRFVYGHSLGSNEPKDREEHTAVVHPEDAAKEFGLSVQMMREARNQCVAKGFTPRKSENRSDGKDFFRYSLDIKAMAAAPNAWDAQRSESARNDAFVPRKPPGSEAGEKQANTYARVSHQPSHESRATAIAKLLPPGEVAVIAVEDAEAELMHDLPCPVTITESVSDSGRPRFYLTSPDPPKTTPAAAESRVPQPPRPAGGDPAFSDEFKTRLAKLRLTPENADLAMLRRDLKCPDDMYFADWCEKRVARASPGEKISRLKLKNFVKSANETWANGDKDVWVPGVGFSPSGGAPPGEHPSVTRLKAEAERRKAWQT